MEPIPKTQAAGVVTGENILGFSFSQKFFVSVGLIPSSEAKILNVKKIIKINFILFL